MLRFTLRRLGFVLLTFLIASLLIFSLTEILPGDVATMVLGRFAAPSALQNLRAKLGLDRPVYIQYISWLSNFVIGKWGVSISTNADVLGLVMHRLRNSGMLALVGCLIYIPPGIFLGIVAAFRRNKWLDQIISMTSLAFIGLPEFVTGVILIAIFAIKLRIFPASSAIDPGASFIKILPQLILPGITIALTNLAYVIRMTRSSTVEVLQTEYVRSAYLKGLRPGYVLRKHVLKNALLPTVTIIAISIAYLIGGLIITESLFSYPGVGRLLLFAISHRDLPLIQATSMLIVLIFSVSNFFADIIYAYLDPRIRYK
ncbi:MAG: ABC transporter permease [Spirochaetes bacterium]|nr:ABC transporter permease [Spirochaetota bacterium]